ncbi:MAG: hypothetical protein IKB70_07490 [Bacilli bacterium]|nr:hypothetical protein [Bacilli bacterium]
MVVFDKLEIRNSLTIEDIFELLQEWGGEPEFTSFGIISTTICHNEPGEGSRKLYYYENTGLFKCYTGCDSTFDIFELLIKVFDIQKKKVFDLNDAVRYIAFKFGISASYKDEAEDQLDDWKFLNNYDRVQNIELKTNKIELKEYDKTILDRFNYLVNIRPWLNEGISQDVIDYNKIGFYPGGDQITIPHFDPDGRLVGVRGRTLGKEEAERFGKYRPLYIMGQMYNHPLGMNLYNLNNSKEYIKIMKKAIVFESEKSCLLYQSYFNFDISVACCGSSLSNYQVQQLLDLGVEEIIIAFDRQFQEPQDEEWHHLTKNLRKINDKYKNFATISFIFDKNMITGYKSSPIDEGPEKFLQLFKERTIL